MQLTAGTERSTVFQAIRVTPHTSDRGETRMLVLSMSTLDLVRHGESRTPCYTTSHDTSHDTFLPENIALLPVSPRETEEACAGCCLISTAICMMKPVSREMVAAVGGVFEVNLAVPRKDCRRDSARDDRPGQDTSQLLLTWVSVNKQRKKNGESFHSSCCPGVLCCKLLWGCFFVLTRWCF